jgi:hypothetical protein
MFPLAQVGALPEFFAVEVEAKQTRRAETDHDSLAIERGRSVAVPVGVPVLFFVWVGHILLPQRFAVSPSQTQQTPLGAAFVGLSEKDCVPPDNRR